MVHVAECHDGGDSPVVDEGAEAGIWKFDAIDDSASGLGTGLLTTVTGT